MNSEVRKEIEEASARVAKVLNGDYSIRDDIQQAVREAETMKSTILNCLVMSYTLGYHEAAEDAKKYGLGKNGMSRDPSPERLRVLREKFAKEITFV